MHNLKLVGALLIVASSSWVGIRAAHSLRRLQSALNGFSAALEQMRSELAFTQSGFAELCASLGKAGEPESARFFTLLGADVSAEGFQPVGATRRAAERSGLQLPPATFLALEQLFDGFGRLDLDGQVRQIAFASDAIARQSEQLRAQADQRCRSYELLGLCAGLAVMILVI